MNPNGIAVSQGLANTFSTASSRVETQAELQQPFTDALNSRISTLSDVLGEANDVLTQTGDRLMGPLPRGISGENAAKPSGVTGEILLRLDSLIALACDLRGEARRLQNGI
jgi:hypothetical protein